MNAAPHPGPTQCTNRISSCRFYRAGLTVVAFAFALAAALTWRKWPDLLVDFGTQLYIPWRITHGAVLYRDLFYFAGGPFSQYFNALLFAIFGVSFSTLIAANMLLAAAMVFVVYRGFYAAADVWTATLICGAIVLVFVFGQDTLIGNYNFITPYSHEATHGLIFSVFAISLLCRWIGNGTAWPSVAAGFCAGLVSLTKPDIFIALAVTFCAGFVLFWHRHGRAKTATGLFLLLPAAIAPPLFFLFLFLRSENIHNSLRSTLFAWAPLTRSSIAGNPFYKWCLGLDDPFAHLVRIIGCFFAIVLVVAFYAFVLRRLKRARARWAASPVVPLILISPLLFWAVTFNWRQCGWPLPLLGASACVFLIWNFKKMERPPVFPLLWSIFGLILLAKLGLFPRIFHYGFVLAMPAFTGSIYLLFWLLPVTLESRFGVPGGQFRLLVGLVGFIGIASLFDQSLLLYEKKTVAVGNGGDEIITYRSAETAEINAALAWAGQNMAPGATLAVLPEGVTLNYLARRANPTPCLFWDPNVMAMFGHSKMTTAFENKAPDYIFIVQQNMSEFGMGNFGSSPGFGLGLMRWIQDHYQTQVLFGDDPLQNGRFGIKILERSPAGSTH